MDAVQVDAEESDDDDGSKALGPEIIVGDRVCGDSEAL
jgi:hypothetical protein